MSMNENENVQAVIEHFEIEDAFFVERLQGAVAEGKPFAAIAFSGHNFDNYATVHQTEDAALKKLRELDANDASPVAVVNLTTGEGRSADRIVMLGTVQPIRAVENGL
jgi:hypothetical protein